MNPTVLIVDDDPAIRKVLEDYLRALGFEIYHATDGYTGWDLFLKHGPELVITDIFMPGMTGVELLEKIKGHEKPAPVVMISGVQLSEVEVQMQKERADGFLDKPYMFWQLKELIGKLLPERQEKS
jgi:two-component system phosphoglycerate transport system response regulator PgtA